LKSFTYFPFKSSKVQIHELSINFIVSISKIDVHGWVLQLQGEAWMQRVTPSGDIEEIFFKHKTVVVSRVSGSENDAARVIKTYTLQTNVRMVS